MSAADFNIAVAEFARRIGAGHLQCDERGAAQVRLDDNRVLVVDGALGPAGGVCICLGDSLGGSVSAAAVRKALASVHHSASNAGAIQVATTRADGEAMLLAAARIPAGECSPDRMNGAFEALSRCIEGSRHG